MEVMVKVSVLIIVILMLILLCFTTAQIFETLNVIYDTTREAVLSQVSVNAPAGFCGMRESSGTARYNDENTWVYEVNDTEVKTYLQNRFNLNDAGERVNRGVHQFGIENVNTTFVNSEGNLITFKTTLTVAVPITLMGQAMGDIHQKMTVKVTYDKRY